MKVAIDELTPNQDNPRLIKDDKFKKLCKSIQDFPQMLSLRPIVVDEDYTILGGNMRYRALQHLGHKEVEIKIAEGLTVEQKQEFVIKDNAGFGDWDWDVLANEWSDLPLNDWGIDLPETWLQEPVQLPEEGEFNGEPPAEPVTVLGDLYELNEHRLHCADSTDSDAVAKLMDGNLCQLVITDPPYGVAYVGKTEDALEIKNDALTEEQTHQIWRDSMAAIWPHLVDGGVIYATVPPGPLHLGFAQVLKDLEALRQIMVWNKNSMVLGHSDYHYKHEPILYGWKPGAAHYFVNDRTKTTVFDIHRPSASHEHPTMKPIALWVEFLENSSKTQWKVYDPFMGSGTTLLSATQTGRRAFGNELDPKYCDVIVNRWLTYMRANNLPYQVKRNGVLLTESELKELSGEAVKMQ